MIIYIIEFSLLFALCWIGYTLFLKKNYSYAFRRHYILGSFIGSLAVPLLPRATMESSIFSIKLPEVTIQEISSSVAPNLVSTAASFSYLQIFLALVAVITLLSVLRYFLTLIKLWLIIARGNKSKVENHLVIHSNSITNPCSFYQYILLPLNNGLSSEEMEIILLHEQKHIDLNHTIEKAIAHLGKAMFWWHPVSWLFTKELSLVHEYEVDQAVLEVIPQETYNQVLFQSILNPLGLRIVNPFSSNIKKRITMMNTKNEKQHPLKSGLLFLLLMVGGMFIHSCQSQEVNSVAVDKEDSDVDFYEKEYVDTLVVFDTETMKESVSYVSSTEKIFKKPDSLPLFPGCEEGSKEEQKLCSQNKLLEFVYQNILYPEEAKLKGIEGVSVVQFVVGEDGYIFDINNIRTIDPSTTSSVNDMMEKMKDVKWIPGVHQGKTVNVQYALPVKFKLK